MGRRTQVLIPPAAGLLCDLEQGPFPLQGNILSVQLVHTLALTISVRTRGIRMLAGSQLYLQHMFALK